MKTSLSTATRTTARLAGLLLLLGTLPTGCKKNDDPSTQASCRITSSKYDSGSSTSTTIWEYNAAGQVTKQQTSSRNEYSYDANGYMTTLTYYSSSGAATGSYTYEYSSGRLSKKTYKSAAGTAIETETYEYDGSGSLTRVVYTYLGSSGYSQTYAFSNGKQTGYIYRSSTGTETQAYTFEDGRVNRYISSSYQSNYEYDAQGRRIRYEELTSGRLSYYVVYEYVDGNSTTAAQPLPKGWPDVLRYGYNFTGTTNGLPAKVTYYSVPTSGSTTKTAEYTYSYTKNGSGFPLESNVIYRAYNTTGGVSSTSATKYTYTYEGCQ